ncbi:MAG: hypothetical protein HFI88_05270 [Lachnospiraceae bacterium]|nr:hypothetical protein [Lachnospiraceae bacterium]
MSVVSWRNSEAAGPSYYKLVSGRAAIAGSYFDDIFLAKREPLYYNMSYVFRSDKRGPGKL